MNTFGGPSKVSLKTSIELSRYEHENEDGVLVFLADTWLDSIKVCRFVSNVLEQRMTTLLTDGYAYYSLVSQCRKRLLTDGYACNGVVSQH